MRPEGLTVPPHVAPTCVFVCTALHTSRLSHSEPPSATPSPALSVESLSSESSSQPPSGELLEPPVVPKSSSEPAVHAPGTPGTSASLSANSSLSSSGELVQPSVDRTPQASPGLAPNTRGSPGPPPAKPCSGAAPTPLVLVGDKSPAPSPGTSSPQLQVKVSASRSLKAAVLSSGRGPGLRAGSLTLPSLLALTCGVTLVVPIYPFTTPFIEAQLHLSILSPISQTSRPSVHVSTCLVFHVLRRLALIYLPSTRTCPFGVHPPATAYPHILLFTLPFTEVLFVPDPGTVALRPCPCPLGAHELLRETGLDDCSTRPPGVEHRGEGMTPFLGSFSFSRDLSLPPYRMGQMVFIESLLCVWAGLGSRGEMTVAIPAP